jgi:hypothetical protein
MTLTNVETIVNESRRAGTAVYKEFADEMQKHCARNLVDAKMKVMAGHDTVPGGVMQTVTKVLRAVRLGQTRQLTF